MSLIWIINSTFLYLTDGNNSDENNMNALEFKWLDKENTDILN